MHHSSVGRADKKILETEYEKIKDHYLINIYEKNSCDSDYGDINCHIFLAKDGPDLCKHLLEEPDVDIFRYCKYPDLKQYENIQVNFILGTWCRKLKSNILEESNSLRHNCASGLAYNLRTTFGYPCIYFFNDSTDE